jgi:hypothetical protein
MGVLSIALPQTFDPVWGVIIIVLGIINLIVRERGMYIANGIALIFIGIINTIGTLMESSSSTFFGVYGVLQVIWGVRELVKYGKYGKLVNPKEAVPKKRRLSRTAEILLGIPLFYLGLGLMICLYELLMKAPWYTYQNIFGETNIIFGEPGSSHMPQFVRFIETLFYPLFAIFRLL